LAPGSGPTTVSSVITLADGSTVTQVQKLQVAVSGGLAYSMVIDDGTAAQSGYTQSLTPVLAVSEGMAVGNYNETIVDTTTGKAYRVVASGPMIENYPVTDAYTYNSSGRRVAESHFKWTPVSGGYALLAQKQVSYSSAGAVTATVISTVTTPATYASTESLPITRRVGSLLTDMSCYFAPSVAYAQGKGRPVKDTSVVVSPSNFPMPGSGCWGEGGILAFQSGIIAVESMGGVLMIWEIPIYLGSWAAWTQSLWHFLECLQRPRRCTGNFCTGGGSSW
jgi:hypothetical protein